MTEPTPAVVSPVMRWLPWVAALLATAGLAISIYLTFAHYTTKVTLACPETGVINCAKVTTSSYATIAGVPVAVLGLAFYAVIFILNLPILWRRREKAVIWGRFLITATGIPMILWLIYVELFKLDAICLYCTSVHIITVILFGVTAYGTAALLDAE